jgi:glucose-1-phosphate thymidylyltransferase
LAQAFHIGKAFLDGGPACLILGDNLFYGHGLPEMLRRANARTEGATIFGYHVQDPERYGVMERADDGKVLSIEEKPKLPRSHWAVVGLYFYDSQITEIAATIQPSHRNEYEITDVNNVYLQRSQLHAELLGRGFAWLDTGTHDSLLEASNFVAAIQRRQGLQVCCPEEIAYQLGYLNEAELLKQAERYAKTEYGQYLTRLVTGVAR